MKALANSMGIHATDESLWSDTRSVRRLLAASGIHVSQDESPFRSWNARPDLALLAIKHPWHGDKAFWHRVVFRRIDDSPVVLDPAASITEVLMG